MQTLGVIGGGIVGLAIAREFGRRHPGTRIEVYEKEARVGAHQTGHNSGVLHAGVYYAPGSLKARLCARGRDLMVEYLTEHHLPLARCGKIVVAVSDEELGRFEALERTARANGVPGLRRLDRAGIGEIEPHAVGIAALHSPLTAITDFATVAASFAEDVASTGGVVLLNHEVTGIRHAKGRIEVTTGRGVRRVDRLVVCAGLQADRVSRWADGAAEPRVVPFRGEYLRVRPAKQDLVRGLVYPVPDPRYPFLGVHFTRRVDGALDVGPNAVLALAREGYRRRTVRARDVGDLVSWPGFWRMAGAHWRTGVREVRGSVSARAFMREAGRYVPSITEADVVRGPAGVRAQALDRDGALVDDFRINHEDGITTVRNAPSPAATSSMAIAEFVCDRIASP